MTRASFIGPAIEVAPEHNTRLRRAFDRAAPRECCGVLLGDLKDGKLVVKHVLETVNTVSGVGGFAIPDTELRRVRALAAGCGLKILAVFHSHPDGRGEPSARDLECMVHSEWPWVIVTAGSGIDDVHLFWHAQGP